MKWVTRTGIRVNRAATAWLIRRFIDPKATFLFVEPDEVAVVQCQDGAIGFDAPGATWEDASPDPRQKSVSERTPDRQNNDARYRHRHVGNDRASCGP